MSCHCVLSAEGADPSDIYNAEVRTARKPHKCYECRDVIQTGEQYEALSICGEGQWSHYKTCLICREISKFFSCDGGFIIGDVWSDLAEYLFPEFHHGCLQTQDDYKEPLSAAAKQKVVDRWRQWKFPKEPS